MTSLLRRKRQTIQRSALPAKSPEQKGRTPHRRRWIALVVAGGLTLAAADFCTLQADDFESSATTQTTVITKGKNGQRLEWVSAQPVSQHEAAAAVDETPAPQKVIRTSNARAATPAVRQVQYVAPNGLNEPAVDVRTAQTQDPLPNTIGPLGTKRRTTFVEEPAVTPRPVQPRRVPGSRGLEGLLAPRRGPAILENCPSPKDLKHIEDLTTNIKPSEGDLPKDCPLNSEPYRPRRFAPTTFTWTASALCHKPLYFEDVQLERYGHMCGPWLQPIISGARFYLTFPILPYEMGLEQPNECIYDLGYYRSGSCAPWLVDPIPLSVRGATYEAGAWVGGCFLFP